MTHIWKIRALVLGLATIAAVGFAGAPAFAGTATATVSGPSKTVNVRSDAGSGFGLVRTVAKGARVTPVCQKVGTTIHGPVRTTNLWDKLKSGGYVSDSYLRWTPARPHLATCPAPPVAAITPPPVPVVTPPAKMTHAQFIATAAPAAQAGARQYHVPASVTLAQAILESGWGSSGLSSRDNNYFGIKCFSGVFAPIAIGCHSYPTHECANGVCYATTATFRVYRSFGDSIVDHGRFLVVNPRYKPAFVYRNQPNLFAAGIQKAGYATSPTYAASLTNLMRLYNLYQYDVVIP